MTKKTKDAEVAVVDAAPASMQRESTSVELFISQALAANAPIETMERLFALHEKVKAERAKAAFVSAMADLQKELPIIKKETRVLDRGGKLRYKYSKLESIVAQTKDPIARHGFSVKFDEEKDEKFATAICIVTHREGHAESTRFKVEIGNEEYMTGVQKYGARMTFAKRYAYCNAFGILTADEDDDGTSATNSEKDAKADKAKIMFRLRILGEKNGTKEECQEAVKRLTGLVLDPKNYADIAARLQATIDENNES